MSNVTETAATHSVFTLTQCGELNQSVLTVISNMVSNVPVISGC